jgi:hypothetical protein
VSSWFSCTGSSFLAVLSWLSCPGCCGSAITLNFAFIVQFSQVIPALLSPSAFRP